MRHSLLISILALLALAVSATAAWAASPRAVVYSKSTTVGKEVKGGLFAVKSGHLNQITEDPTDTEPAFSADGRTIAFARGGDIYSIRPDGSGQRQLTSGAEIDAAPIVSPNGSDVVFERRAAAGAPARPLHGRDRRTGAARARPSAGGRARSRCSRPTAGRSSSSATPIRPHRRPVLGAARRASGCGA